MPDTPIRRAARATLAELEDHGAFRRRHIGPGAEERSAMLAALGYASTAELVDAAIPRGIRRRAPMELGAPRTEGEALSALRLVAGQNQVFVSYIGQGYYGTYTPTVIQRNVFQNPAWYTAYTPYQPEISQGRLEALLNFQTMVADLTGLDVANASMLDEATAAAEAMALPALDAILLARLRHRGRCIAANDRRDPHACRAARHRGARGPRRRARASRCFRGAGPVPGSGR